MWADPRTQTQALRPVKESLLRLLLAATVATCALALLITLLSRTGDEPAEAYSIFRRLFAFNDHAGSVAMLAALLAALAVPGMRDATSRLAAWIAGHPATFIGLTFVVLALSSRFVYLAHPLSMDEYTSWMQARAFAQGDLAAHYPPALLDVIVPQRFQGFFIAVDPATGDAISRYWPGLAVLMAPFAWLDLGWCLNPAFGALTLTLIFRLASDAADDRVAGGWAVLAALASPQFTVNSISYYAMPGELALNLLFLWLLLKPGFWPSFAAGLSGGLAITMHNPAPHVLMAAPCLAWLAWNRQRWPRLLAAILGYVPLLALGLAWAGLMSAMEAADPQDAVRGEQSVVAGMASYVQSILTVPGGGALTDKWYATWKLWIWTCPGLLLAMFFQVACNVGARLLLAAFITTYLFYFFVAFDQGHGWGYRYVHTAWAAVPVMAGIWAIRGGDNARRFCSTAVAAGLLATPAFFWHTNATVRTALSWRINPQGAGDWVVFVSQDTGLYRGDLVQNPPGQSRLLYLVSRGHLSDDELMAAHFPHATLAERDHRGSAWRLPEGSIERVLERPGTAASH